MSDNELRTLGDVEATTGDVPARDEGAAARAEQALAILRAEFQHVLMMKEKLAAESAIGGREKGRDAGRPVETVRTLLASLEGMNRFALKCGLITPAESRALYAEAMEAGLYEGWR